MSHNHHPTVYAKSAPAIAPYSWSGSVNWCQWLKTLSVIRVGWATVELLAWLSSVVSMSSVRHGVSPLNRKRSITVELGAERRQLIWELSIFREHAVYPVAAAPTRAVAVAVFLLLPSSEGSADCGTLSYLYRELFSCYVCSPHYCIFCGVNLAVDRK